MKILEIIHNLGTGGAQRFVVDLCNQFIRDGHQVTLMILKKDTIKENIFYLDELSPQVTFLSLGEGKCNILSFYKVYSAIKSQECDIVHMHLSIAFFGILSLFFDRSRPYVITCHNQAESERNNSYIRYLLKKIQFRNNLFDYVAISKQNAESIKRVYKKEASALIYNGRDKFGISYNEESVEKEVNSFRSTNQTNVFACVATFSKQKNLSKLVRCFNEIKNQGNDVVLIVIGAGYDSVEGKLLQKEAMSHIYFLGPKHNVGDYFNNVDFFTLSSDYEGMPITLIESMACGCIPVGTPVSGFNDVIKDGINGFVAKDFSDKSYMDAILRAITMKNKISKEKLISDYKQNFSIKICAQRYENFFQDKIMVRK